jgi:hypothetical protein
LAVFSIALMGCPGVPLETARVALPGSDYDSRFEDPVRRVIRSETEWWKFWNDLYGDTANAEPPAVDFEQEMIIVVALGGRPSPGYSIDIDVFGSEYRARVRVRETKPCNGQAALAVMTFPVAAFRVQRIDEVRFVEVEPDECGP